MTLSATTIVSASPIIFINPAPEEPGHFDWTPPIDLVPGHSVTILNITISASEQDGAPGGFDNIGTFVFDMSVFFDPFIFPNTGVNGSISPGFGGRIYTDSGLGLLQPGDIVGLGGVIPMGAGGGVWSDDFHDGFFIDGTSLPIGEHFLGVSFREFDDDLNNIGDHFGFIGINVFENPDGSHDLLATSWGYETEIGVPITIIPAPPSALVLAAGGLLTVRRRRA